jgi:hypothetical protein
MYGQPTHQPKNYYRFYIVMITVVIMGIFFLLFMNSNNDFGLTSLSVSDLSGGKGSSDISEEKSIVIDEDDNEVEKAFSKNVQKSSNEVDVALSFDRIPDVKKEAKVKDMVLTFDDLTTKIKVNDDRLELSNLKEVSLKIKGFEGELDFDNYGISLEGISKSIAVNEVVLSSKGEMKIAFNDLDYRSLVIDDIEIIDLELDKGNGEIKVAEKLTYSLEQDQLKMYYFNGKVDIQRDSETSTRLEGVARGIIVSGALLNFNLR